MLKTLFHHVENFTTYDLNKEKNIMAVPYKLLKTKGGLPNNAEYRIVAEEHETMGMDWMSRQIERATSMTPGDLMGALIALKEEMVEQLKSGYRVHLPGFGYFSLAVKGDIYEDSKTGKVRLRNAGVRTINFRPEKELLKALADTRFDNVTYRTEAYACPSASEVDAVLKRLFERADFILPAHLRHELHLSESTTYRWVHRLLEEGKIINVGTRQRKIFVRGAAL